MKLESIVDFLDKTLQLERWSSDKSNNGLQVECCQEVNHVVVGVDASLALFEEAASHKADLVIVHHGISWGSEPRRIIGATAKRFRVLFDNNISLYAAHLPLDAHPTLGNNAKLSEIAKLTNLTPCCPYSGGDIGFCGTLPEELSVEELAQIYETALPSTPYIFDMNHRKVKRVVVVSGGGGMDAVQAAIEQKADVLVTGEFDQMIYYPALENNIPVISLGHYASETVGVKALLAELIEQGCSGEFINLPTGV